MSAALAGRLSVNAMRHKPLPTLVSALGLAAVLAPLLILYGLKSGIVTGLVDMLKADPTILRVHLAGAVSLRPDDIADLRRRPQVGFAVGAPSTLAARMTMSRADGDLATVPGNWLPSAAGDPLLPPGVLLERDGIALAEPLAERLRVGPGDQVLGLAYRNNESETFELRLTVAYILPRQAIEPSQGSLALVHEDVIDMRDAFQGNYEVPALGIPGKPLAERQRAFSSVRLYAASFEDVVELDRIMSRLGFRAESKAANIEWVRSLELVMGGVFGIISVAGVLGFSLSLWANVTSNLQHYRGQLSLLRLLGLGDRALAAFPAVQVLVTATGGLLLAAAISGIVALIINRLYLADMFEEQICRIEPVHILAAAAVSYGIAIAVVAQQLRGLKSIAPSEALAENV